jgi:hypothetical protein
MFIRVTNLIFDFLKLKFNMKTKRFFLIITSLLILISCNKDVENVVIQGYIYEKNSKAVIPNQRLYLLNYYYEGGDYDGFANVGDVHKIITNEKGYYSINLRRSAYIQLDTVNININETTAFFIDKYIYKPQNKLDFYMLR